MTTNDEMNGGGVEAGAATENPLLQERDELQDRLLRTAAEFDNYRKRTDRDRRDLHDFITTDLVREFLPVLDDLARTMSAAAGARNNPELTTFLQGVTLIHRQWLDLLRKRGIEVMDVVGQPFDPEWHEAVGDEPAHGRPDGEITAVLRPGYRIGSKLLRAPMVKVAKA